MNNVRSDRKPKTDKKRSQRVARSVTGVITGSFLTRENVVRQLPFLIFIVILALVYISNSYSAEKLAMTIESVKKENEVLRYEHILMKSKLMDYSRQPEIARKLKDLGVKESIVPPQKIYTNRKK
jgi:hypothetical protein